VPGRRRALSVLRTRAEKRARQRCEYCHAPQRVSGHRYHIEHIIPKVQGGSDGLANRALACATCNLAKLDRTMGYDPQTRAEVPCSTHEPKSGKNIFAGPPITRQSLAEPRPAEALWKPWT
jgi:hypothetical protein